MSAFPDVEFKEEWGRTSSGAAADVRVVDGVARKGCSEGKRDDKKEREARQGVRVDT